MKNMHRNQTLIRRKNFKFFMFPDDGNHLETETCPRTAYSCNNYTVYSGYTLTILCRISPSGIPSYPFPTTLLTPSENFLLPSLIPLYMSLPVPLGRSRAHVSPSERNNSSLSRGFQSNPMVKSRQTKLLGKVRQEQRTPDVTSEVLFCE